MINKIKEIAERLHLNHLGMLIYRLGLVMLIFTIMRIAFFFFNQKFFTGVGPGEFLFMLYGGLRFDLVAILYTNILFILMLALPLPFRYNLIYQKIAKGIFMVTNSIIIAANAIDFIYFRHTMRRTTVTVVKEFENELNFSSLAFQFFKDYWYIALLFVALVYLLSRLYGKPLHNNQKTYFKPIIYYPTGLICLSIAVGLFVAGVRGGFLHSTRPITLSNAGEYVRNPVEMAIVLNTPFSIFKTLEITYLDYANYFENEEELDSVFTPLHRPQHKGPFKAENVVIIIVESLGKEYIGALNNVEKGYTPFLDSLVSVSKTFRHSFANGKKSIDAMPSVLAGIPSLVEPYVVTPYSGNKINSLANLLKKKDYTSAFFHGAPNGSMGFLAFANIAGYDKYYGKSEYGNDKDYDGIWGIWDEEFLQFSAQKMNEMKQPFLSTIFTVSSHHPYKVPERYEGKFPKGDLRMHQCIAYTDYALKQFFEKAASMPWFNNTLFIITGDHTNADTYYKEYQTPAGIFSVPLIFYKPGSDLRGIEDRLAQQNDIMPTVLNYLNYDEEYIAFGQDVFAENNEAFVVNYNGYYQIFMEDYLLQFDGQKPLAFYNFKTDTFFKHNLINQLPEQQQRLENKIKALIQQYNRRLIDDDLLPKKK
jgi:arylsulfatase A-like enzyme